MNRVSTTTESGIGNASQYWHVKLSDTYSSKVASGAAANGMAASQNALYESYNELNTNLKLTVKDVIMIGDSYVSSTAQNPNWTDFLASYLNVEGAVYKNGVSGACFSGGTGGNLKKFETILGEIGGSISNKKI